MPTNTIREFFCPSCSYTKRLQKGEADIIDCPACSHGQKTWTTSDSKPTRLG